MACGEVCDGICGGVIVVMLALQWHVGCTLRCGIRRTPARRGERGGGVLRCGAGSRGSNMQMLQSSRRTSTPRSRPACHVTSTTSPTPSRFSHVPCILPTCLAPSPRALHPPDVPYALPTCLAPSPRALRPPHVPRTLPTLEPSRWNSLRLQTCNTASPILQHASS